MKTISLSEFATTWEMEPSDWLSQRYSNHDFNYTELSKRDFDAAILKVIAALHSKLEVSGPHRIDQWERGWKENLEELNRTKSLDALTPKYFQKYGAVRWKQRLISPCSSAMEHQMLNFIVEWVSDQFLCGQRSIYEFGCGTGNNLRVIRSRHRNAQLYGLDWSKTSQKIIKCIAEISRDNKLVGINFDYFAPDTSLTLDEAASVITVASLEQVGGAFDSFIDFILENKPRIVVHIEPIAELLNPDDLLDYLSLRYFEKRNYLSGFLTRLRQLEDTGKIEIVRAQRSYVGSLFIDGYSVIVWRPK